MRTLLDVSVLIALLDAAHQHHQTARAWLTEHIADGWASCALTQNGCIRILSQPTYPNPVPTSVAMTKLAKACATTMHVFWKGDVSLLDPQVLDPDLAYRPNQLTDLYLLALAVRNDGRLLSFDRKIPLNAVRGATAEHLSLL